MKILGHCAYIGNTGYAVHSKNFFRALSKEAEVKIRNFSIDSNWQGINSKEVHGDSVDELDKKILALQTCGSEQGDIDVPIYNGISNFNHQYDIVLIDCHHRYYDNRYLGKKIFYNVWEKTTYSEEFFNKLKCADQVWVPTDWQKICLIKQGIQKEKVKIVPEGIDPEILFPDKTNVFDKFTFLILGKWETRKSTKELIKAYVELFGNNDNTQLLLSCSNNFPDDDFKSTSERLKNINVDCKNIKIIDFQHREEVIKMIQSSHVYLSCSKSEGWNLPLIESLACGIPSIYSDCSGQLEFAKGLGIPVKIHGEILDKKNPMFGYYSPDYNDLKDKMLEVYNSYAFYKEKALKDSFIIRENFTWEKAAKIATQHLKDEFEKKEINITNESASLGDFIAWTPIVARYAREKNIKVNYFTPYKEILEKSYPELKFHDYSKQFDFFSKIDFKIGCFVDLDWRDKNLQEIACLILGLTYNEEQCKIKFFNRRNKYNKKYVCIATQSTLQCKYWNNKNGWIQIVDYLNKLDYDVVCIDRYESFGLPPNNMNSIPSNAINKTGDIPLEDRVNDLRDCEFFIGLGSGLSWLAWACGKPVIMISGFSDPKSEFYTPYRVHNKNVCNSCWNDSSLPFERDNWLWCPKNKNFECSREITFEMVREKIDSCISDSQEKKNTKIIAHHFNENLNWLDFLDDSFDYVIYSRTLHNTDKIINIDHDKGVESYAYLKYIIDNYDNLPENMIFIHAHRNSWHQDKNIDLLIKELDLQKKYFNFNNNDIVPLLKNEVESEEEHFYHRLGSRCTYKRSYKLWVEDVWFELFNGEILMPEKIDGKGSAQFLVKKEKVLIYTKDFYIRLLNWLLITEIDEKLKVTKNAQSLSSQVSGRILEYVWNVLYEK
jgi:autotransporter strand-loop-strand O-heptosyltransferase